jgi:hypothetical protein
MARGSSDERRDKGMDCDCFVDCFGRIVMSWIHIAERRVNDCVIVQYEDVGGFHEYEVYRDDAGQTPLGWFDNDEDAEAVTR